MKMLICTIGSKQHKNTLHFAAEVAKALQADAMLLGVLDSKRNVGDLGRVLAAVAAVERSSSACVVQKYHAGGQYSR